MTIFIISSFDSCIYSILIVYIINVVYSYVYELHLEALIIKFYDMLILYICVCVCVSVKQMRKL